MMKIDNRGCSAWIHVFVLGLAALLGTGCSDDTTLASDDEVGESGEAGEGCLGTEWVTDDPDMVEVTHASVSRAIATIRGLELGDQIRIERSGAEQYALYTVAEIREVEDSEDPLAIGMNAQARLRLGMNAAEPEVCAHLVTKLAPMPPEFTESAQFGSTRIVVLAPHGGKIEEFTDAQAEVFADVLAAYDPTTWICRGYHEGGGAFRIWHIPSTEISPDSFPLLDALDDEDYDWAVAFHGSKVTGKCVTALTEQFPELDLDRLVMVGGRADLEILGEVRDGIAAALGSGFEVVVVGEGPCGGTEPENLVNWLSSGSRSVQIESGLAVRTEAYEQVALAVALALEPHLE